MLMKKRIVVLNLLSLVICVFLSLPKASGQDTDSLSFVKESMHFNFYSAKNDINVLDSLAIILENNYTRITKRLGIQIDKKIDVRIFPDIKSYHVATNQPDAPDWVVGTMTEEGIMMVSPLNPGSIHTHQSLMQVVVHEFVHFAVYYACGEKGIKRLPRWLNEGYAQYEAGQINKVVRRSAKSSMIKEVPPTLTQLDTVSAMEFGYMNGYALSVSAVEFMIDTYGIDKLVLLIKEPENPEIIYGLSKDALEKQWIEYVKEYQIN